MLMGPWQPWLRIQESCQGAEPHSAPAPEARPAAHVSQPAPPDLPATSLSSRILALLGLV